MIFVGTLNSSYIEINLTRVTMYTLPFPPNKGLIKTIVSHDD